MAEMPDNLIILGAGATAAIATNGHRFPTAKDFFDTSNAEWASSQPRYPHLSLIYNMVRRLKADNKVDLTDVWLFADTVLKYHSAMKCNQYDYNLLRKRYEDDEGLLPEYLKLGYLNDRHDELCREMRPLFSTAQKHIYCTFRSADPVNYFLVLAGWELKHLLFKTYCPDKPTDNTYLILLDALRKNSIPVSVVNLCWDIYFERACHDVNQKLQIILSCDHYEPSSNAIALCKPHGGWNIRHRTEQLADGRIITDSIEPVQPLHETIADSEFDKLQYVYQCNEVRPAMIPYFASPDEIKIEHKAVWPPVGEYFMNQQCVMKRMLREAKRIVSIGYRFSKDDKHVRRAIEEAVNAKEHEKSLLCILKQDSEWEDTKKRIRDLWLIDNRTPDERVFRDNGFNEKSVECIVRFFSKGQWVRRMDSVHFFWMSWRGARRRGHLGES